MNLFKHDNGNLCFFLATTAEEEKLARAAGYKTLEELYPSGLPTAADPDAVAAEEKTRKETRKGRK